jgi:hypothetical protein
LRFDALRFLSQAIASAIAKYQKTVVFQSFTIEEQIEFDGSAGRLASLGNFVDNGAAQQRERNCSDDSSWTASTKIISVAVAAEPQHLFQHRAGHGCKRTY